MRDLPPPFVRTGVIAGCIPHGAGDFIVDFFQRLHLFLPHDIYICERAEQNVKTELIAGNFPNIINHRTESYQRLKACNLT